MPSDTKFSLKRTFRKASPSGRGGRASGNLKSAAEGRDVSSAAFFLFIASWIKSKRPLTVFGGGGVGAAFPPKRAGGVEAPGGTPNAVAAMLAAVEMICAV